MSKSKGKGKDNGKGNGKSKSTEIPFKDVVAKIRPGWKVPENKVLREEELPYCIVKVNGGWFRVM